MSVVSRWLLFLVALWIQSAGIVFVVKSFLGTSPISSLPYVMSETFPFTFGETTFAVNMVFLLGQILILKKKFPKVQLLQAPMTMIFAAFIDLCMQAFGNITPDVYWQKLIILFLGASMVSLGVALQGIADVLKLPGEGLVYTISDTYHLDFGKVKIANDGILVTLAICLSYLELGSVEGVREGTLISVFITGIIARFFLRHLSGWGGTISSLNKKRFRKIGISFCVLETISIRQQKTVCFPSPLLHPCLHSRRRRGSRTHCARRRKWRPRCRRPL